MKLEKIVKSDGTIYAYEIMLGKPNSAEEDFQKVVYALNNLPDERSLYHINIMPRTLLLYCNQIEKHLRQNVVFEIVENHSSVPFPELSEAIKKLNIKISIDDFGNGASNFDRLYLPNVVSVKIDRELWQTVFRWNIVRLVAEVVRSINAIPIAEKVETKKEFHMLRSIGFTLFQGRLFLP